MEEWTLVMQPQRDTLLFPEPLSWEVGTECGASVSAHGNLASHGLGKMGSRLFGEVW